MYRVIRRHRLLTSAAIVLFLTSACVASPELSAPAAPQIATTSSAVTTSSTTPPPEVTPSACPTEALNVVNPWDSAAADAVAHPGFADVDLSASIWVEGYGEVVAHNPDLALFPASNQKLFTALGALSLLDQDHQFTTSVELSAGALVLRAGGDPTLRSTGTHSLTTLAQDVARARPERVTRLVVDAGYFESATTTKGRQDWQLPTYTGPLSAFVVDDNRWRTDEDFVNNPALENGELFAEKLRSAGLTIETVEHVDNYADSGPVLASLSSAAVAELTLSMLMSSDNEIAESLLREMGEGSTAAGIDAIDELLHDKCPNVAGESGDGSGLSRANLRASRDWRKLLQLALVVGSEPLIIDSLPVAGKSGTMSQRLTGAATFGNVAAKTGTIIGGRALSGYATTVDGHLVIFSIITNGEPQAASRSVGAIDNLIAAIVRTSTG